MPRSNASGRSSLGIMKFDAKTQGEEFFTIAHQVLKPAIAVDYQVNYPAVSQARDSKSCIWLRPKPV